MPLNGEGEAVEAGVNVSVKTATDTTAEGVMSDTISASEAADKLGGISSYQAPGRLFSSGYSPRRFCCRWLILFMARDGLAGGANQFARVVILDSVVSAFVGLFFYQESYEKDSLPGASNKSIIGDGIKAGGQQPVSGRLRSKRISECWAIITASSDEAHLRIWDSGRSNGLYYSKRMGRIFTT